MGVSTTTDSADPNRRSRRHYAWAAATVGLVAACLVGAVLAARVVAGIEADQSREEFDTSSANIASTVELAIQHEDDIVVDAGGLLADPDLSQTSFVRWATAARVLERYPEMTGLAVLQLVDDADLAAFAARAESDPTGPLSAEGTFEVVPAGPRSFYCLVAAVVSDGTTPSTPAGTDHCAEPLVRLVLLAARDSGRGAYLPYPYQGKTWLAIQTPMYAGGVTPPTVDARRQAFARWVVAQLDPTVLLQRALRAPAEHGRGAALQAGRHRHLVRQWLGAGRSRVDDDRGSATAGPCGPSAPSRPGASPMAWPWSGSSVASR